MKHIIVAIVSLGFFGTLAQAAVTLNVDEHIKVTAINGQPINQSPFKQLQRTFTLEAGQHVITARYDRLYDLSSREHDYLRSADVTVSTVMQDNQNYRLAMLGQPERYNDAKEYVKAPTLAILSGNTVLAQATGGTKQGGLFSGLGNLLGRGNSNAVLDNQRAIHAIHAGQPNSHDTNTAIPAINNTPMTVTTPPARTEQTLDSFIQLWLHANEEERNKIRQWVQQ